MRLWLWNAKSL